MMELIRFKRQDFCTIAKNHGLAMHGLNYEFFLEV